MIEQLMGKLDALSPLRVLERGYSIVRDPAGAETVIRSAKQVRSGQELQITFCMTGRSIGGPMAL